MRQPLRTVRPEACNFTNPAWGNLDALPPQLDAYVKSVGDRMLLNPGPDANPKPESRLAAENAAPKPAIPAPTPTDHTARNRQNAQFSTGPKTPEGKAQSSKNAFRHGLASNRFLVFDWEKVEDFHDLLMNLRAEHRPSTQTEALLVEKMAEHFWLSQRALRLQDMCFHSDVPFCQQPKDLALYIRYGTTHDRAFHKCIAELAKLRAQKSKEQRGFESQKREDAAETRKQDRYGRTQKASPISPLGQQFHETRLRASTAKKPEAKTPAPPPTIAESATVAPRTICNSEIPSLQVTARAA